MKDSIRTTGNTATISLNPKAYPLDVIYSAAYVFLDRAYIILDGDPATEVLVRITPKQKGDPEAMAREFGNELINYADYHERARRTRAVREMILQRALLTNDPGAIDAEFSKILDEIETEPLDSSPPAHPQNGGTHAHTP